MKKALLSFLVFAGVLSLISLLYWLTLEEEDPCANPQTDISAAVLAEGAGDQSALTNRAILARGDCEKE